LDELNYLYDHILYWSYERGQPGRAGKFLDRFGRLLKERFAEPASIFGEECWSLFRELSGDLAGAIRHREREIELILKLWDVSAGTPGMPVVLERYGTSDLSDRYDLLAILYHDAGDLDGAIVTLMRSKWLCESFKVPYEGESLLQDYLYEKNVNSGLVNALLKQGWRIQTEGARDATTQGGDHVRRARTVRFRRKRADG
jgi:hypothetical protein